MKKCMRDMKWLGALVLIVASLALPCRLVADAGVLIPRDKQSPDAAVLSLVEMKVDILIDNGDARVRITQVFANHTNQIEEGTYTFALPDRSTVSDFAVWDGPVRIPAVILERKRAEEIYDQARMQAIDPGLLEMGERDDGDPKRTSLFSAKIVPIPAWGTKRLELEYHQKLTVNDWKQVFALPLKPDAYLQQKAGHLELRFELRSANASKDFQLASKLYPLKIAANSNAQKVIGVYEGNDVSLDEDFVATWKLDSSQSDTLNVITYRNPKTALPLPDEHNPQKRMGAEPGFFQAEVLIGDGKVAGQTDVKPEEGEPRTVVVLFDNSLSMQWEKLERSYAAMEALLRKLRPVDHFNLLLFNQEISSFKPQPVSADSSAIQQALDFVRSSKLRGGTDLGKALGAGLKQCTMDNCALVLLTDGGSDRGETVLTSRIASSYARQLSLAAHKPKTDIFAVGDDANLPLLKLLARNGVLEHVLSTEPVEFKLDSFLSKIVRRPIGDLRLTVKPEGKTKMVYPLDEQVHSRSVASWIGEYDAPTAKAQFTARGTRDGAPLDAKLAVDLPAETLDHPQLPRLWAQARVNALLDKIARDGESRDAIDEIIRLARRYKLVTPYTSFLAVPRALLRPRVIRPGDPILRVHTDPAIQSVIALFPFGLTKPLRHLADEDTTGENGGRLWETRFLAPEDMKDGTYNVRLILRDDKGNTYREAKTFVIASTPPTVKILLNRKQLHAGESVMIRASASASTRTLTARLDGVTPVSLRWSRVAAANVGTLVVPQALPVGRYTLTVTAEDIAHNLGSEEVQVEVIP